MAQPVLPRSWQRRLRHLARLLREASEFTGEPLPSKLRIQLRRCALAIERRLPPT